MIYTCDKKREIADRTFLFDKIRATFHGILEGGFQAFAVLIAIRVFSASSFAKSVIAAAGYAGLLITPITIYYASQLTQISATKLSSASFAIIAFCFLISTINHSFIIYLSAVIFAKFLYKQQVALMIGVYGDNYDHSERGSKLSYALMLIPISSMIFANIGGHLLDYNISNYRLILFCMFIGAVGCSISVLNIPSNPVPKTNNNSFIANLAMIWQDKFFRKLLLVWTILGIDNQMTIPLRIEYLANSDVFIGIKNWVITSTVIIIPAIFRIISTRFWGKAFDKFSLPIVAVTANLFLAIALWIFFTSKNLYTIMFAEALIGISHGGGLIIWCLWITKIVPKQHYSSYMSVNTVVVGIRNIIAPFIGYSLLHNGCSFATIGKGSSLIILLSITLLLSMQHHSRFTQSYEK